MKPRADFMNTKRFSIVQSRIEDMIGRYDGALYDGGVRDHHLPVFSITMETEWNSHMSFICFTSVVSRRLEALAACW